MSSLTKKIAVASSALFLAGPLALSMVQAQEAPPAPEPTTEPSPTPEPTPEPTTAPDGQAQ